MPVICTDPERLGRQTALNDIQQWGLKHAVTSAECTDGEEGTHVSETTIKLFRRAYRMAVMAYMLSL